MKLNKHLFPLIIFVCTAAFSSFSQTKTLILPRPIPAPPPGNIKLLPDYTHEKRQGIDTQVGRINKENGLEIRYDIGKMAGNITSNYVANHRDELVWYKGQKINNDEVWIGCFKDGKIMATFVETSANFFAETKTQEDVIDFLLMVLTYESKSKK